MVNDECGIDIDSPTLDKGPPTLKAGILAEAPIVNLGALSTDEEAPKLIIGALTTVGGAPTLTFGALLTEEVTVIGVIILVTDRPTAADVTDVP